MEAEFFNIGIHLLKRDQSLYIFRHTDAIKVTISGYNALNNLSTDFKTIDAINEKTL